MKIYPKKFLKIIFIAVLALCFGLSVVLFASAPHGAQADGEYSEFLPNKSEEYYALNSPIYAYSDDEITAITTNNKELIISHENEIEKIISAHSLKQVMRFNDYLLYSNNQTVTAININNTSISQGLSYLGQPLNCVSFDIANTVNGYYIATISNLELKIFSIDDNLNIDLLPYFKPAPPDRPEPNTITVADLFVALNENSVFYVVDNKICRRDFNDLGVVTEYSAVQPTCMIANNDYLYYIDGTDIYRLSIANKNDTPVKLTYKNNNYDLDYIQNPQALSFKNDKLLVTDLKGTKGSVQEFKINGDTLEFTGYAIASGLSAYNRVAANATDIERYGKYVAALDGKKLTVIDTDTCTNYNKEGFINKFVGNAPDKFALGNGTILYSDGGTIKLMTDIKNDTETEIETNFSITALSDMCYQSGKYYIIYTQGATTTVVKVDEQEKTVSILSEFDKPMTVVTADVFGNIYAADNAHVYKNEIAVSYDLDGVTKLATDLAGNLFALAGDGKIYKLAADANHFSAEPFDVTGTLGTIKTFGMDFDRSEMYFLIDGKEQVYRTVNAGNVSLEDVTPNAEFNSATTSKKELKIYAINGDADANVYSVSQNGNAFKFNGLIEKAAEYPLIAEITVSDFTMCALASENGVVLINKSELEEKAAAPAVAPEKAFLTTSVYAYAIPVIEKNGTFAMVNESGKIKLDKGATIAVNGAFTLLGKTFYDATAKINGEDLPCYIPADFTATVLAENYEFESYTVEKVKQTVLYKNADLTEELFELEGGETVKLLENKDGVLKVAVTYQNGTVVGYITENSLIENPSVIVRNVLIILAVFGSLAGTISYFLLRKKR